jgi:hypothetical protein
MASGDPGHLVDALAAGGPAAASGRPILLTTRDSIPAPTQQALTELGVTSTVVVGGATAVSDATMALMPGAHRIAGVDRYATAVAISDTFSGLIGVAVVTVASGEDAHLVDALVGGALGHVTLLTPSAPLAPPTVGWLQARVDAGAADVVGGPTSVADATQEAVRTAMGG